MQPLYFTPRFKTPVYKDAASTPWDAKRWPNFKPAELACKGDGLVAVNENALDHLQALRTRIGKPFYINSAYRSPSYNAKLSGAASGSFHMEGIAFDVSMRNHDPHEFKRLAEELGFDGIGTYPGSHGNFIHIDTRGYTARWGDPF